MADFLLGIWYNSLKDNNILTKFIVFSSLCRVPDLKAEEPLVFFLVIVLFNKILKIHKDSSSSEKLFSCNSVSVHI